MTEVEDFAAALAAAITVVMPAGFAVTTRGSALAVLSPDGFGVTVELRGFFDAFRDRGRQIESVASSILNTVQDVVSETLTVPSPQDVDSPTMQMAVPGVSVTGDRLRLWYGRADAPSLLIGELNVADLCRTEI